MDNISTPTITEEEIILIKRAKAGDESAFTQLFYKYKKFVESVVQSYLKDESESQEIANLVFTKVFEKLHKFTRYQSFGGWLRILAKNTAIDYVRKLKVKELVFKGDDTGLVLEHNVESQQMDVVDQLAMKQIFKLLKEYPSNTLKIFELYYVYNMTVEKISDATGIPTGTIKSTLARTRRKLQKQLKLQPL